MATCDKSLRQPAGIRSEIPSFSSSLLDAIYRSIDETNAAKTSRPEEQQDHRTTTTTTTTHQLFFYREFTMKKDEEMANFRRACMIQKWIEKKAGDQKSASLRRNSMADFDRKARNIRDRCRGRDRDRDRSHEARDFRLFKNSSSSSSESSSCTGAGFSSSESESFNYGAGSVSGSRLRSSSAYNKQQQRERPKPIKTTWAAARPEKPDRENHHDFIKTKSKLALKFYGELKKAKQPTSPGGRLAGFLNTLFSGGSSPKKSKSTNSTAQLIGGSISSSACSSASSFSRSCLSKTPSSRGSVKRSVSFCPVSVIVDEDSRPCGHKNLQEEDEPTLMAKVHGIQGDQIRRVSDNEEEEEDYEDEDEDDDDDALSYSSSDLFELDNLSELPVFETTHFDTGRPVF